jgi:hypothetical protein
MSHFLNDAVRAAIAFAGDIASLASLALTLLVYFNIRKLRRAYLFTARVPELTDELTSKASELLALMHVTSTDSKAQIQVVLAEGDVLLRSLKSKVDGPSRASVNAVLLAITEYQWNAVGNDSWRVYVAMQKCLAELRQAQLDLKWDRQL